ncbi:MAG: apolipoprotein N-acyltransferase [Kangiellaceae bacterium]|jgi:apolipoprotein N-acyltransferase|nr:apolipoprotein N-acyltransferase [Kangiellaceae bacterium]
MLSLLSKRNIKVALNSRYFLAFFAGAIYPLGLAPLGWWPILLISLASLIWLAYKRTVKQATWLFYSYGLGFYGVGVSWIHVSIHQFGGAPLALSVVMMLLFIAFLSLFKALGGYLLTRFSSGRPAIYYFAGFPVVWLIIDLFQASLLTGFPWLYVGYGLVESPLSGWISATGVYGASYFVVLSLSLVLWLYQERNSLSSGMTLTLAMLIPMVSFFSSFLVNQFASQQTGTKPIEVAILQPNIPQDQKWAKGKRLGHIKQLDRMYQRVLGADLIVWPEAAVPAMKHHVDYWIDRWQKLAEEAGSDVILGIPIMDRDSSIYSSLITLGSQQARYDKQYLVPFGEFVPFAGLLRGLIEFFNLPMSSFSAGDASQPPIALAGLQVYPAICYEVAYSELFRNFDNINKNQKDSIIVTISNDAWFGASWGPHQHLQIAQARALEGGTSLIRATNTGISAIIDHQGRLVERLPQFEEVTFFREVELSFATTWFKRYSFWSTFLLVFGTQLLILISSQALSNRKLN